MSPPESMAYTKTAHHYAKYGSGDGLTDRFIMSFAGLNLDASNMDVGSRVDYTIVSRLSFIMWSI